MGARSRDRRAARRMKRTNRWAENRSALPELWIGRQGAKDVADYGSNRPRKVYETLRD
jgi:hypothetical protein